MLRPTLNHSTNEEVSRAIVDGVVCSRGRFNNFSSAKVLAPNDARIADRRLKDTDHVTGKKIGEDKSAVFVFWDRRFLDRRRKEVIMKVHNDPDVLNVSIYRTRGKIQTKYTKYDVSEQ